MSSEGRNHDAVACVQGFADVDPWLDGTLRFGGGYSTWSPPANSQMAEVRMHLAPCNSPHQNSYISLIYIPQPHIGNVPVTRTACAPCLFRPYVPILFARENAPAQSAGLCTYPDAAAKLRSRAGHALIARWLWSRR